MKNNHLKNKIILIQKYSRSVFFISIAFLIASCGNEGSAYRKNELLNNDNLLASTTDTYDYSEWLNITDVPSDALCPQSENITPSYDKELDQTGKYRLCKTTQKPSIFYFSNKTQDEQICIFPAYYTRVANTVDQYSYHTFKTPGSEPGTPYSACFHMNSKNFLYVDFIAALQLVEGSQLNAAYIVPFSQRAQMAQCLRLGNPYICPQTYSFGKVE